MESTTSMRLKVLISAYACEPGKGSEPGVGWNMVCQMAQYHEVWVITRANNRKLIENELDKGNHTNLNFKYYDLPEWARFWKKCPGGVWLYYYLWQIGIYWVARKLHKKIDFNVAHHVTFVKYTAPSFLSLLPIPFIWGPVGGGEVAPKSFGTSFGIYGKVYEKARDSFRWVGELDPFVRLTAKKSILSLATTEQTATRLRFLHCRKVTVLGESGLTKTELRQLEGIRFFNENSIRFISIGRLLHWKGFHLGLRAFAQAKIPLSEYWILGEGPERKRLEFLAGELSMSDRIKFHGHLPRGETLKEMGQCHVLVHPSLHDSGGWVCLEAMGAGKPVICLDLGGPATQVTPETGFKVRPFTPKQVIREISTAMVTLATDHELLAKMGNAGHDRVAQEFLWDSKREILNRFYQQVAVKRS